MGQNEYQPTDRRPIKARGWWLNEWLANQLVKLGVSANLISVAGAISGIISGLALAATSKHCPWERVLWITGAVFIQLRLIANLLDGMVAIGSGKASSVGELYNEIPDRVSDTAIITGAGYAIGNPLLGLLASLVAIFTAYVRTAGKAAGAPHYYLGPMAKQHRMALLTALALYCALIPNAWRSGGIMSSDGIMTVGLWVIVVGGLITALRRILKVAMFLKGKMA